MEYLAYRGQIIAHGGKGGDSVFETGGIGGGGNTGSQIIIEM